MSRFRGRFDLCLDNQGRINIPAKFRRVLDPEAAETFVICFSPTGCLWAYSQNMWNAYEDEISQRPQTRETLRSNTIMRNTLHESTLDAQGRITLSSLQMKMAGLVKNVTLIGHKGFIEIWDSDRLNAEIGNPDDYAEVFFKSVEPAARNIGR